MVSFPVCKINLGLHIINKRADGYHNLETCFYPVSFTDILEIIPSASFAFTMSGTEIPGAFEDNLCVKAYQLLEGKYNISPVKMHLHKNIPTGAGLGGGSSDAAYTLRLLNTLSGLNLTDAQLIGNASQLGSDCAFFVRNQVMLGKGRGEILETINLSLRGMYLMLVNPSIHISTAEAFSGIRPRTPDLSIREILETLPRREWRNVLKNDFEEAVFIKYPVLSNVKETLYALGAVYASMSGSGSAVYGIFDRPVTSAEFPGAYSVWCGILD